MTRTRLRIKTALTSSRRLGPWSLPHEGRRSRSAPAVVSSQPPKTASVSRVAMAGHGRRWTPAIGEPPAIEVTQRKSSRSEPTSAEGAQQREKYRRRRRLGHPGGCRAPELSGRRTCGRIEGRS